MPDVVMTATLTDWVQRGRVSRVEVDWNLPPGAVPVDVDGRLVEALKSPTVDDGVVTLLLPDIVDPTGVRFFLLISVSDKPGMVRSLGGEYGAAGVLVKRVGPFPAVAGADVADYADYFGAPAPTPEYRDVIREELDELRALIGTGAGGNTYTLFYADGWPVRPVGGVVVNWVSGPDAPAPPAVDGDAWQKVDGYTPPATPVDPDPVDPGEYEPGWLLDDHNTGLARHGLDGESFPEYVHVGAWNDPVPAGTRLYRQKITQPLNLSAGDIVIEQCLIAPTFTGNGTAVLMGSGPGQDHSPAVPVQIIDCDIHGDDIVGDEWATTEQMRAFSAAFLGPGDVKGCNIWNLGSGIAMKQTGTQNPVIEGNYVHDLYAWGDPGTTGNHVAAFTIRDFNGTDLPDRILTVRNNRFVCDSGNDSGACFIQPEGGWLPGIHDVLISGNLLAGRGFNLAVTGNSGRPVQRVAVVDNRFDVSPSGGYGPVSVENRPELSGALHVFEDNYHHDQFATDHRGAPVTI